MSLAYIISFLPHNNLRRGIIVMLILQMGSWGTEREYVLNNYLLSYLIQITVTELGTLQVSFLTYKIGIGLYMVRITLYARQQKRHRLLDPEGEGEGGMIWENGIETCILSCKKRISSLCSKQDTGCLGLVQGDDPERWYGVGGERGSGLGTHVHPWRIHVNVWQNQYSIVK